eukprot:gene9800-1994_t
MADPMDNYEKIEKLGEGTYGSVYKASVKDTGQIVALKKIKLNDSEEYGVPASALREIALLLELNHPNIVSLMQVVTASTELNLILEFVDEDLRKHLNRNGALQRPLYISYMKQLLAGLEFCHINRILHRDLKPENLLIDKHGVLKLADFGLARAFGIPARQYTHEVVTLWYRAPEIILGVKNYACPVDMWSVGCIFAEMVTGRPLFPGDSEIDQLFRIFRYMGTPNESIWPGVSELPDFKKSFPHWPPRDLGDLFPGLSATEMNLLVKLIVYPPIERLAANQALQHKLFQDEP